MLDKVLGSFVGLAVGDALGVPAEFKQVGEFEIITGMQEKGPCGVFKLNPGEWTDDTSMALALADSLLEHEGSLNLYDMMARFIDWWQEGYYSHNNRCFDIGTTTRHALATHRNNKSFPSDDDPFASGNGSIMRLAPAVLAHWNNKDLAVETAMKQGGATHPSQECIDGCHNMALMIYDAIHGKPKEELFDNDRLIGVSSSLIPSSGYVVHTLLAAQWAIANSDNFKDALLNVVNLGDDADTTGAVTGQIAGALYGFSGIPSEWIEVLAWKNQIIEIGERLYDLGLSKNP